jgi:hypothetical protein
MERITPSGPMNLSLGAELQLVEALFLGACRRVCEEIGLVPELDPDSDGPSETGASRAMLEIWLSSIGKDPDLGQDIRMTVPVFYDVARKQIKIWAILGLATKPLRISHRTHPTLVEIRNSIGWRVNPRKIKVEFHPEDHRSAYFAAAEVYVSRIMDRTEFRCHCDRHKTYRAIVENLG